MRIIKTDVILMSDETYLTGKCPRCGEELRIPERLSAFSCMFCGAKLTPGDLVEELPPSRPEGDAAALLEKVRANIVRCVTDYPEMRKNITRKLFHEAFSQYEQACGGVFEDLDLACRIEPEKQSAVIGETVEYFLDRLEESWRERGRTKPKYNMVRDDDKITIAIFLVPLVGKLKLSVSEEFCDTLHRRWMERYPKSPFFIGSYDDISAGFQRKFKLCFITTAVCRELGKPDDCPELTAFRAFRDGYLMGCPDGPALVEEYYEIAPGLVVCLDLCGGPERYRALREESLFPCYEDILAGRNEACRERYISMVRKLEREYLS